METRELRTFFQQQLSTVSSQAFYGSAPPSTEFPYLVYNLSELLYEDGMSLQELEVDAVDYGYNTAPSEDLADSLVEKLHGLKAMTDSFFVAVYRERRQPIYENDKKIIRRRLTFQVRVHERSAK